MSKPMSSDLELKEICDKRQFAEILRQWLHSIEKRQDFEVRVQGQLCHIPIEAVEKGRFQVEYEVDKGEMEFELKLKWK